MAESAPLPPSLKATLAVVTAGWTPMLTELNSRGPRLEGVEWSASWPEEGLALLRVPLLLPGARVQELLRETLGGTAVAREVRELRVLVATAGEVLQGGQAGARRTAYMAMADALEALAPGITMLEVQARLRGSLNQPEVELTSLSHYDVLIAAPADLEASWIRSAVDRAYASLAGKPMAVLVRSLASLEALLPRLPLR